MAEEDATGAAGFVPPPQHVAADRAAVLGLREAERIAAVLAEAGVPDEPVVLNRQGPRRSIAALDRMLAEALAEDERAAGGEHDATG